MFIWCNLWHLVTFSAIFLSSQPCQQHLQHMGQRALQDVWWWCLPVFWYVWIQPGLWLPRVLPGVLSAPEEERERWKPYCQLFGCHHQWPFLPHHKEPGLCQWPAVSRKPCAGNRTLLLSDNFALQLSYHVFPVSSFHTTMPESKWKKMLFTSNCSPKLALLSCGMVMMRSW